MTVFAFTQLFLMVALKLIFLIFDLPTILKKRWYRRKLQKINSLDKEHLREYYREVLGNGAITEKGTAGLGMIDIARKSGNKLEYEFLEIDKYFSFFSLNVKID